MTTDPNGNEIAIVGLAGRFPGASDLDEFWRNLCDGVEAVESYSDEDLAARGVPEPLRRDPRFVRAAAPLAGVELFDASFFGYTPREAELIDPQQRAFLECACEALDDAGYGAPEGRPLVGVFGGAALSTYLLFHIASNPALAATLDPLQINLGNANSFLTTRASYKLDLRGPSFLVESACSTSLVAVHVACQSLLSGECDLALAGGASINLSVRHGYRYVDGGILSPDGRCRPFDASAKGIVFGSGVGVVALRRLSDALEQRDHIYAVIRGSAVNNDGAARAGYTAPGVEGQAQVIAEALANADVPAESIRYVEAHGTGTPLGDPIEVAALTRAFRADTQARSFCAIASLKANVGHLDAAAGVAGLIKATLALKHGLLPPSINVDRPNPTIDWASSPFYVPTDLAPFPRGEGPLRAGVSSFGMGGTNAHIILEEAPHPSPPAPSRPRHLFVLSAKTASALDTAGDQLAARLRRDPHLDLADVAFTLQTGRRRFAHRRAFVCDGRDGALEALAAPQRLAFAAHDDRTERPVVFLFPGQGAQHLRMAASLYASEPTFRQHLDECASLARPALGADLLELLYPTESSPDAEARLDQTEITQPLLFAVEYALAKLLMSWGVEPEAMVGHSVGEYVAACLAGAVSLRAALALVAARGRLLQALPPGAMLSVALPEAEAARLAAAPLAIAAVNAPELCTIAGPAEAIDGLERALTARGVAARRLRASHAFHSPAVEPALAAFTAEARRVAWSKPKTPWVSNLNGDWIAADRAPDASYWAEHLRRPVRFGACLDTLARQPGRLLLEVGPGRALSSLARRHVGFGPNAAFASLGRPGEGADDANVLEALGRLWAAGARVDWKGLHAGQKRRRVPLPTYPFERQRYWIDPGPGAMAAPTLAPPEARTSIPPIAPSTPPAAARPRAGLRAEFVAPRDETERAVAAIWSEVLGIAEVGVDDNFFELGGHSLLATAIVGRLRDGLGVAFPLQALFDAQTVARMAGVVASLREGDAPADEDPAVAALLRRLAELEAGDPTEV